MCTYHFGGLYSAYSTLLTTSTLAPYPPVHSPPSNLGGQVIPLTHPGLRKPQLLAVALQGPVGSDPAFTALTAAFHAHSTPATLTSCSSSVNACSFQTRGLSPQFPQPRLLFSSLHMHKCTERLLTAEVEAVPTTLLSTPPLLMSSGHLSQSALVSFHCFILCLLH